MTSFVLIPGAGGAAWYWHRLVPLLERAGNEAVPVDLPGDDENAGLDEYAELVVRAIGDRSDVVLVAQSLGGFTAPLVCQRVPVRQLVFVNAMIPLPGETAGNWGKNTGSDKARNAAAKQGGYSTEFDVSTYFFHDVPDSVTREAENHDREEAQTIFKKVCQFEKWPDIPIHVVVGNDDRLFPADFQERVARERLDQSVDRVPGGHLVALSNPEPLAALLLGYLRAH